jgi:hypothetical protein
MIITDDQQQDSPRKLLKSETGSTIRPETPYDPPSYGDATVSSPLSSPTSPLASPMSTGPYYSYQAIPSSALPFPMGSDVGSAKRARRRFVGGLTIALVIYIALVSFLSVRNGSRVKASHVHAK